MSNITPETTYKQARSKSWVQAKGGPILACIDMGTNSFHMIVCRSNDSQDNFEVLEQAKDSVPFFRSALWAHFIDESAVKSALRILREMKEKALAKGATRIIAVATSAVRESRNGEDVLRRIREELDIDARMISGYEEARLIYLGVLWSLPQLQGRFAIIDIGGGSTELIVSDRNRTFFSETYKLGAARLAQRFFKDKQPTPEALIELHNEVVGTLRPAAAAIKFRGGFERLIGTSGTVQALAKIERKSKKLPAVEGAETVLSLEQIESIVAEIEKLSLQGEKIPHVSPDRNQTILAGSIVLLEAMHCLETTEVLVCKAALREGTVVDQFLQTGRLSVGLSQHEDPRSDNVHALLDKYHTNVEHAEQVTRLAEMIFKQTHGILHDYPPSVGHLLWSAAMLHDVGTFIGRSGHHKHSYYLIINSGLLGHSEEEVEQIANIARYHRGSAPKTSHPGYASLSLEEKLLVTQLSSILRIAEALDRSHHQVFEDVLVNVDTSSKFKVLNLILKLKPGQSCGPELWALQEKKGYFEENFQVRINPIVT
jgi:exopolyphosphatase/guanosine-5'-triphosphate,3'-diphosphate pyrophosphatase